MPRTSTVRYFRSRQAYYTTFQGRQHLLAAGPKDEPDGKTYKAAVLKFSQLMHAAEVESAGDECQVSALISRYYFSLDKQGRKRRLAQSRTFFDPIIPVFGNIRVREVKPFVVNDWVYQQTRWNDTSKHMAISALIRAFNWAKEEGIIKDNPIAGMGKPEKGVRGKEVLIPEGLQEVLIASANVEFAKFLSIMRGTGARPGELSNAQCKHYRKDIGAIVLPWNPPPGEWRWKCGRKTKRDRIIYLTPELQTLVEGEIIRRGGEGFILQTVRRKQWLPMNLVARIGKLMEHPAVRKWCKENKFAGNRVMMYGFRHSYITRMLQQGCPIKVLADLCGTSVAMIERVYGHTDSDLVAMRRLFLQFSS